MASGDNTTLNPGIGGDIAEDLDTFAVSGVHAKRQVISIAPRDLSAADSIGGLTEAAPGSDTAPSGLNGRLQRIAQRLTALITALGQPYNYTPLTPGQFGLACAASTPLSPPAGALQAVVSVEGNSVRYTFDGTTAPTASVGHLLSPGQSIQFSGATVLANLRFIQVAATATLNIGYTK